MPIAVHCPSCQALFHVGDEFAGRPGRCPECGTVLRVPDSEPEPHPEPHPEPDPYRTSRPIEPHDDDRPFPSRRRRDDEDRLREDFDDRPKRSGFDPHARAAAWERVAKGLWYLQVAVLLYAFSEVFFTGFILARGMKEPGPNDWDSGHVAVFLGSLAVRLAAVGFWLFGRFAAIRVPYVPARGWAKASFGFALTTLFLFLTTFCMFVMALGAAGQGQNPGAVLLMMITLVAFLALGLVAIGAEASGLASLIQIGRGLRDAAAAGWAKLCLGLMVFLLVAGTVGMCGFMVYVVDKQQKAQAAQKAKNPPPAEKAEKAEGKGKDQPKAAGKEKAPAEGKANGKANPPAPGPGNQPQPDPIEPEPMDETTQLVFNAVVLGIVFLYLLVYSITLAKARGAIRREIKALTGEADRDPWETDHRY
jgi:hypothetical protein